MPHVDFTLDGVRYPSVTEVLGDRPKPWLDRWREKWGVLAERKTKAATNVGTKFHEMAEGLVLARNVFLTGNRRLDTMAYNFDEWAKEAGLRVEETELHVISRKYKYQGTFDAVGHQGDLPRLLTVYDWKTSSGIYPEYAEQLAAYANAYEEQTGKKVWRGIIVHVSKDKPHHKLTIKEYKLNKRLFNKFLKRLREYNEARS